MHRPVEKVASFAATTARSLEIVANSAPMGSGDGVVARTIGHGRSPPTKKTATIGPPVARTPALSMLEAISKTERPATVRRMGSRSIIPDVQPLADRI
ncbi:MAG TPA: hypothetical protein PLI54_08510 [Methanoculleus sp.]|nr:hypothetical protein [Methanoculleus sp.]